MEEAFMERVTFLPGIKGGVSFNRPGWGECGLQKKQACALRYAGESLDRDRSKGVSGKGSWEEVRLSPALGSVLGTEPA